MKLSKYTLFTVIFIVLAGIFAGIQYYIFGVPYAAKEEAPIALVAEIILSLLLFYYVKKYATWKEVGFGSLSLKSLLWILPLLLLNITSTIIFLSSVTKSAPNTAVVVGVCVTIVETFVIGFAEETMFRGILLHGLLKKYNVFLAMFISAVGFSLLHSVNVFAGYPFSSMIGQLGSTLMYGLLLAPLAILVRNLWPLIINHFLWDFTGLAKSQLTSSVELSGAYGNIIFINQMLQPVVMVVAWLAVFVIWKKGRINQLIELK